MAKQTPEPDRAMAEAIALHRAGRLGEAAARAEAVLAARPGFADALNLLAIIASQRGDGDRAVALFADLAARFPGSADHALNLGAALTAAGRAGEAAAALRRAVQLDPRRAEARHLLGLALAAQGRADEARTSLRRALRLDPGHVGARSALAALDGGVGAGGAQEQAPKSPPPTPRALAGDLAGDLTGDLARLGQRALDLHRAGRLDEAEPLYRRVLAAVPDHADTLHYLGVIRFQRGDPAGAAADIGRAVALDPGNAGAQVNLGNALKALRRFAEAESAYRRALELTPDSPEAHNNLAAVLRDLDRFEESERHCRRALALKPDYAEAGANLGNALVGQGRLEEAVAAYQDSLARAPHSAEVINNLGSALVGLDRGVEARACFERAIELDPGSALALNNLGTARANLGDFLAAAEAFRRALDVQPESVEAWSNLAAVHERASDLAAARAAADEALARDPGNVLGHLVLAKCDRRDGDLAAALARLEGIDLAAAGWRDRAFVAHETGQARDRMGDTAGAFAAFAEGNRLSAEGPRGRALDRQAYPREIAALRARFTPDWVATWTPPPPEERPAPVFLVGFPRSGTTLLGRVLDAHPRVRVLEERATFAAVLERLRALPGGYPDALAGLDGDEIRRLRGLYFEAVALFLPDLAPDQVLVDKMPFNLVEAGLIRRLFPTARFLLALRHPADACLSCFMQDFRLNRAMINFDTLAGTVDIYDRVMGLWRHFRAVLDPPVHAVRYEDVVAGLEGEARRLFDFLDLPWDDVVLDYGARARSAEVRAPSYHQVAEPLYTRALDRWRRYEARFDGLLPALRPYMAEYGYDRKKGV